MSRQGRPKHEINPPDLGRVNPSRVGKNSNNQNPNALDKSRARTLLEVVVLTGQWGVFETEGKKLLLGKRSSFKEPTGAATYEALVAAESRAVAALNREIAEATKTRK
jgi:hypothetical protein